MPLAERASDEELGAFVREQVSAYCGWDAPPLFGFARVLYDLQDMMVFHEGREERAEEERHGRTKDNPYNDHAVAAEIRESYDGLMIQGTAFCLQWIEDENEHNTSNQ